MAIIYLRSTDGLDTDDGSTWALAKATLAAALTAAGVGGTVYVSHVHDYNSSSAAISYASPGTVSSPVMVLCVNDGAEPPTTLATTGIERTTGDYSIAIASGYAYIYGMNFTTASAGGINAAADLNIAYSVLGGGFVFDACALKIGSTSAGAICNIGVNSADDFFVEMNNTTFEFSSSGQYFYLYNGRWIWENTPVDAIRGTVPTTRVVYLGGGEKGVVINWNGLDLDQLANSYLFDPTGVGTFEVNVANCKLATTTSVKTATAIPGKGGTQIFVDNCDSGDTNYRFEHYKYEGSIVQATNCYLNATYSMKMIPITGAAFTQPLISPPIAQWNTSVGGALTATVEIIHNEAAALQDDEVWLEIEYLGTLNVPLSLFANDRMTNIMSTPANQTTSTAAWIEDLTGEIKQKLVVTFTPQEAGYVVGKVYIGKVTTNPVYVDPYLTIA